MLKGFVRRGLFVGLVVSSCLAVILVVYGLTQQEEGDSTRPELKFVRVKIGMRTPEDLQYLKAMGIECPKSGECVVIITEAERRQIEKAGLKAKALTGLRPDKGPNQVEYKLVKEIDLKADGVETIVFGPKKDKGSALSEIILGGKDEDICVYDSNLTLVSKMHLYRLSFSKNLRYLGGIRFVKIPHDVTEKGSYKVELFDYTGKKLWELERELYYDAGLNSYSISSKGTVIERHHGSGEVSFYDQKGNEIKKTKVGIGGGDPETEIGGGVFSDNGKYVLITIEEGEYPDTLGQGMRVLLFTWDGDELWRFNTEENARGGGWGRGISKFGNYVIVSSRVWPSSYPPDKTSTYLLSREGKLIKKYEGFLATRICFSSNEKYALFHSPYQGAFLIDLASGEVLLQYGEANSPDIAEDAKMFGLASSSAVSLIGFDGSKVWSETFPSEGGRVSSLRLSDDGKQMIIAIGSKVMIYQKVE